LNPKAHFVSVVDLVIETFVSLASNGIERPELLAPGAAGWEHEAATRTIGARARLARIPFTLLGSGPSSCASE